MAPYQSAAVRNGNASTGLPVIEFPLAKLIPGSSCWALTRTKVRSAMESYGCFEAVVSEDDWLGRRLSHDITTKMFEEVFEDVPPETKEKHIIDFPFKGYTRPTLEKGTYESLGLSDVLGSDDEKIKRFTNLMWPCQGNHQFSETLTGITKMASEVIQVARRMIFESYGLEMHLHPEKSMFYLLQLSKYESTKAEEEQLIFPPHTDKDWLTIIYQNNVHGLVIQSRNGEWIKATPSPFSFLLHSGEAFMAWSNGKIHCPEHKVAVSGSKARYMMGLFTFCNGVVETPQELVDEEHPLKYRPFNHFDLVYFAKAQGSYVSSNTVDLAFPA